MENIKDYNPTFEKRIEKTFMGLTYYDFITVPYEKNWYCHENRIIHHSEKEVLNCKYCSKKYYSS